MNDTHHAFRLVLTTADSTELAEKLARELVERRLAACVNVIGPVLSIYRWKGEVTSDEERLLLIKTAASHVAAVRDTIRQLHGYEVPEVLAFEVVDGDPAYLAWLGACLGPETG